MENRPRNCAPQSCDKENRPRNSAPQSCDTENRPRYWAPQSCDRENRPRNSASQSCDRENRPRNYDSQEKFSNNHGRFAQNCRKLNQKIRISSKMWLTVGAAAPLPCRGGVGGGVSIFIANSKLQTPPPPLPLMGGERLRIVPTSFCNCSRFCYLPM